MVLWKKYTTIWQTWELQFYACRLHQFDKLHLSESQFSYPNNEGNTTILLEKFWGYWRPGSKNCWNRWGLSTCWLMSLEVRFSFSRPENIIGSTLGPFCPVQRGCDLNTWPKQQEQCSSVLFGSEAWHRVGQNSALGRVGWKVSETM